LVFRPRPRRTTADSAELTVRSDLQSRLPNRVHRHLDQYLARRGFHPALVHWRIDRAFVSRVRGDVLRGDSCFRDCFVNAHADALRPFSEKRGAIRFAPLNAIGFFAAAVETALLIWLSLDKKGAANRPVHEHGSGWLIRIGEVLNGPLALVLRSFGFIPWAAISFLAGALVSRIGWIAVGKVSGADSEAVFASQR